MRTTFVETLAEIAAEDDRTMLLTADLGFMALEPFSDRFPDRFINVGVSEQNMIGIATGLAEAGFRPYCYSIAPFASLRPLEFIRDGPVLHRLPVRIVGVGGGFEYGAAGPTHHGIDDIGILRVMTDLTLVAPADAAQTANVVRAVHELPGPAYLRIGKDERRVVTGLAGRFELGRAQTVRTGEDIALVTMGSIAAEVEQAAIELESLGVSATVIVVASLTPAPVDDLYQALSGQRLAMTIEAHSVVGGVGSLVSEVVAQSSLTCRLIRKGVTGHVSARTGSEAYLHGVHGIDRAGIVEQVLTELKVQQG